jgi:PEP-CTERM motif
MNWKTTFILTTTLLVSAAPVWCGAGPPIFGHITNGIFQPGEWNAPNVTVSCIAQTSDGSGGGCVYVQQGGSLVFATTTGLIIGGSPFNTLYLGYDDLNPNAGGCAPMAASCSISRNTTFDVFFQVQDSDYLIHMTGVNNFTAYEKDAGTPSQLNADGSFDFNAAPWELLDNTDPDFQIANFQAALGFGPSPDSCPNQVSDPTLFCNPNPHLTAEFQLSINTDFGSPAGGENGLYDPSPAFWSGTGNDGATTIISEDFTLNGNGTTDVTPHLDANGNPIQQDNVVPEPSTMLIAAGGGALWLLKRRRR